MEVVATYSHANGKAYIESNHQQELRDIYEVIKQVDATKFKTKISKEKTMVGKALYAPKKMNLEFKRLLSRRGWETVRINVKTQVPEIGAEHKGYREIDGVKNKVGLEVQFGKYAFMIYNVSAKMTIFHKQGIIDCGVEVVPMRNMSGGDMSTGVSSFEQMKTDLEYRGVADIDIPVFVIGVDVGKQTSKVRKLG
jgi:hypothetical protein